MGGTTAKASLIENGAISRGREYEVGGSISAGSRLIRGAGELLRIPTIDIAEVGAGGGSIAWLDPAGGLQVGPKSAGAAPGPACYGRGGVEPTVTDANVVLGFMPAGQVADGQITIQRELAEAAVRARGRAARALGARGGARDPPHRERAHDAGAAVGLVGEGPRPARLRDHRLRRLRARPRRRARRRPRRHDRARAAGGGAVQRRRPALRPTRVPRGALLPPRRRHGRSRPHHRAPRRDGDGARERVRGPRRAGRGCAPPTSATAARAGRSRWSCRPARSIARSSTACASRFEDEHEVLYGVRGQPGSPVEVRAVRLAALGVDRGAAVVRRRRRARPRPSRDPPDVARRRGGRRAGALARVDRSRRRGRAAARRRVRHDGRRPGRLDRPPAPRDGDARARAGGADG